MAGRSAKHTAFRGWVSSSTAKWRALVWGDDAGGVSEHVSKLRIRAIDGYSKASSWVVSEAFTVAENAYPEASLVSPVADEVVSGNTPYLVFEVSDADGDTIHMEVRLSLRPDAQGGFDLRSAGSQDGWEQAAGPAFDTWEPLPPEGATSGYRVRYQCPALRYDTYWLTYRTSDGILTTPWAAITSFDVTVGGSRGVTCTIGDHSYRVMGTRATERTGGEASPLEFRLTLADYRAHPFVLGASVSVGLAVDDQTRAWNGRVEDVDPQGAEVAVKCLMDDSYLAHLMVTSDAESQDVGLTLKGWVDAHGGSLGSSGMMTDLGVTVARKGGYKSLLDHIREWTQLLGLLVWVDAAGEVHLTDSNDLADPTYILHEGYE